MLAGREAALAGATAMIDVSDGLVLDLGRVADASAVTIDLDGDDPVLAGRRTSLVAAATTAVGDRDSEDLARSWVLTGGEEHALAACFAGLAPQGWDVVGSVRHRVVGRPGAGARRRPRVARRGGLGPLQRLSGDVVRTHEGPAPDGNRPSVEVGQQVSG